MARGHGRAGPSNRPYGARKVVLDLGGEEWDWLAEQAVALGIPLVRQVRHTLEIAAPMARDPERFDAYKNALFEARQAAFGFLRKSVENLYAEFQRDPSQFIPANHRANPAILASHPAWEEPKR